LSKKPAENELDQQIIRAAETAKPESAGQLADQVQTLTSKPREEILNRILKLQQQQKIHINPPQTQPHDKLSSYLTSSHAAWYWITMALTIATPIVVFTVPENAYPLVYVRFALGAIFVVWLPGYTFIKALFLQNLPLAKANTAADETSEKDLDTIERMVLSIGISLALVSLMILLLNYTPWGIRLTPIVVTLFPLIIIFATTAIIREYQTNREPEKTPHQ
jgi:hypothetical protein